MRTQVHGQPAFGNHCDINDNVVQMFQNLFADKENLTCLRHSSMKWSPNRWAYELNNYELNKYKCKIHASFFCYVVLNSGFLLPRMLKLYFLTVLHSLLINGMHSHAQSLISARVQRIKLTDCLMIKAPRAVCTKNRVTAVCTRKSSKHVFYVHEHIHTTRVPT